MEDLEHARVGKEALQFGRVVASGELHQDRMAIALRELHQAEPVAMGIEPHGLGVDGDRAAGQTAPREVPLIKFDGWRLVQARSAPWRPHSYRAALKKAGMVPRRRLELPRPFGH